MRQKQKVRPENMTPKKLEQLFEEYIQGVEDRNMALENRRIPTMAGFAVFCGFGLSKLGEFFQQKQYHELFDYVKAFLEEETVQSGTTGKNQTWHIFYSKNRLGYKDEQKLSIENTGYNEKLRDKSDQELIDELKEVRRLLAGEQEVPDEAFDVDYEDVDESESEE